MQYLFRLGKLGILSVLFFYPFLSQAQFDQNIRGSNQFRMGERLIRIAEPGQLADTVSLWGDVGSTGRYLIPEKMNLQQLISYSGGPRGLDSDLFNWSKVSITILVSRYSEKMEEADINRFEFFYNEPMPSELYDFSLENEDVVSVDVRRRPNFLDYIRVASPILSTITSILILTRQI